MLSDLDLKMSFEVHGKKKCPEIRFTIWTYPYMTIRT